MFAIRKSDRARKQAKAIKAQTRALAELSAQIRRLEQRIDAISRHLFIDAEQLEPPYNITARRFRAFSQNGEDGVTLAILQTVGPGTRRFVDIGCGIRGGNSRYLAEEFGWSGLMLDAREDIPKLEGRFPPGRVTALQTWITRENVNQLIKDHGYSGEIDLLSIDVDGMDFWLWDAITACSPRLVIVEYNSYFGPTIPVTVPYEPDFNRKNRDTRYYGASLAALVALSRRKGYRLVAVEPTGVNAFFLRDDLAPSLPGFEAEQVFRRQPRHELAIVKGKFDMGRFVPEEGLPLRTVSDDGVAEGEWRP